MYKTNSSYKTDKKANARYWDEIDSYIANMVVGMADFSATESTITLDDVWDDGIHADIREIVIGYLKERGCQFPYVDTPM